MKPDAPPLVVGGVVDARIEKSVYRGRGLARVDGQVLLVPRAHAGDRVRARVVEAHAGWAQGSLESVVEPAPLRRESPCPYVPRCGGCVYQDLGYDAQLGAKEAILRESLARAGAPWEGPIAIHRSPEEGWRLRAGLHFAVQDRLLVIGLRQEGSRRVVDVERCLQLSPAMSAAASAVAQAVRAEPALWPRLRGLDLLESMDGQVRLGTLVTSLRSSEAARLRGLGGAAGLAGFGVETAERRLHWLSGPSHVDMPVLGFSLRVHARSFFQANRHLVEPLARTVLDLVPEATRGLDLYGGVGLFALPLASRGLSSVVLVEQSPTAVADAKENAKRSGHRSVRVWRGDVAPALSRLPAEEGEAVVVDPPRTGLEREVVDRLADRRPAAIVYVSCDPTTLGRDLQRLAAKGLRPDRVHLFDMFPDTFHLETVVRLCRA